MRRSWALVAWAALLASMPMGSTAHGQFDDFPDDASGRARSAPPQPPQPPARAPAAPDDSFDADFGGTPPAAPVAPVATRPTPQTAAPAATAMRPTPQPAAPAATATRPTPQPVAPASTPDTGMLRPPASEAELDPGAHAVRLRELEQSIHELKERIFRSKARLALLAESVLEGLSAGARAHIVHEDAMGPSYRLVRATYAIDGAPVFNRQDDEGALSELDEFDVFDGSIVPGEHTLSVTLEYRGHGFGVFSYLRGYRFRTRASYSFTVPDGREITVRVTGFEDGGPNVALEDRPALRFGQQVESIEDAAARREAASSEPSEGASSE